MKKVHRECWNRCDECGRFIPYSDFESKAAVSRMVTPDSDLSAETFEVLCKHHYQTKENSK